MIININKSSKKGLQSYSTVKVLKNVKIYTQNNAFRIFNHRINQHKYD